jgi:hypothetical protein
MRDISKIIQISPLNQEAYIIQTDYGDKKSKWASTCLGIALMSDGECRFLTSDCYGDISILDISEERSVCIGKKPYCEIIS